MFDDRSQKTQRLLTIWDVFFSMVSFVAAIWIQTFRPDETIDFFSHIAILPFLLVLLILSLSYFDAYRPPRSASNFFYIVAIVKTMTVTLGILFAVLFFLRIQYVSRMVILTFAGIAFIGLTGVRMITLQNFRKAITQGKDLLKVLIIGSGKRAAFLSRTLTEKSEWGIDIIGYLDTEPELVGTEVYKGRVLGTISDINAILSAAGQGRELRAGANPAPEVLAPHRVASPWSVAGNFGV
jgi:FlaA1/EpsC-like NDP-sugar epimerase